MPSARFQQRCCQQDSEVTIPSTGEADIGGLEPGPCGADARDVSLATPASSAARCPAVLALGTSLVDVLSTRVYRKRRNWPCQSQPKTARGPGSEPTNGSLTRCTSATRRTPTASTRCGGTSSARTSAPRASTVVDSSSASTRLERLANGTRTARSRSRPARPSAARPARREAEQPEQEPSREQGRAEEDRAEEARAEAGRAAERPDHGQGQGHAETRRARTAEHQQADPQGAGQEAGGGGRRRADLHRPQGRPARTVANMDASLDRPDRHQRARGPGQAAVRQPHRDQQPPRPRPRRQGLVHPPHRLRDGPGAARRCRR